MEIFLINLHSFVDVITNSSSELFIMDSKKSVETVRDFLRDSLDLRNGLVADEDFEDGCEYTFDACFGFVEVIDESNVDDILETLSGFTSGKEYTKKNLMGKIAIRSNGDNSIPWSIQEWIENTFNATRIHLG